MLRRNEEIASCEYLCGYTILPGEDCAYVLSGLGWMKICKKCYQKYNQDPDEILERLEADCILKNSLKEVTHGS